MANALSRRALLATPLVLSACAAPAVAALQPANISDELAWLLDTYDEIAAERAVVLAEIERLIAIGDQPFAAEVLLKEVASREQDYPPENRGKVFFTEASILRFFESSACAMSFLPKGSPFFVRMNSDRRRALALYQERAMDRSRWEAEVGINDLDERDAALSGKLHEIEKWLRAYTCRSLGDVIAIAAFADRWLPDDEPDIDARSDLLRAISAYAKAAA